MRWLRPVSGAVLGAVLAAGAAWSVGFDGFVSDARGAATVPAEADGIVVLTGGAERIETAVRLLSEGRAPALLISGVGKGSDLADIAHRASFDPAALADRITLDHQATTTLGNAAETASWAREHGVRRLIVVTAGYHMRRALLEIARDLPEATLYPVPVQPRALRGAADVSTAHLLATEYDKLLAVRFGLSRLLRMKGKR